MQRGFLSLLLLLLLLLPSIGGAQRGVGPSLSLARGPHQVQGQLVAAEDGVGLVDRTRLLRRE